MPTVVAAQQVNMTSPGGTKFWIYTPPGYSASNPAPMLINLHGQGQIGSDITLLTTQPNDATPAYLIAHGQWPASRPFIVVSPQLKRDISMPVDQQDWPADYIDEVVEYVKNIPNININPDKIYIMGLSLGGQGCMIYGAAYPNKVAGMIPISGRTDDVIEDGIACSLVNIPMWIFHGTEDITLNYTNATNMAAAINACPNPGSIRPHVTLLDAMEHNGTWNPIYNLTSGYPIYDWLLQFTKNSTVNLPPHVNVGTDKKFLVSDGPIYLFSDYFDADGSITSVSWTQTQGAALTLQQTNTNILKITNLQAGTFQFTLTVTDNLGAVSTDNISVDLLSDRGSNNAVTGFTLTNAAATGNPDIGPLVNEQVITKSALGTNDFNVRAAIANNNGSVVFRVNGNQNTRVQGGGNSNIYVYPSDSWYFPNGWKILVGDHVVCATPNTGYANDGTDGISKCVKFSVLTQPIQNYYPKPGANLSLLASWGTDSTDGSGTSPLSFTANFQIFNVTTSPTQNEVPTIGGNESALWVRSGGEMTVNNTFTGVINVEGTGIVNVNTNQSVSFGTISNASTIRFGTGVTSIPTYAYGNVEILGSGTKTLGTGTTIIKGNLVIANNVTVNGAADNTCTIQLTGNLTLEEDNEFNPANKFSLTFSAGQPHAINLSGTKAVFNQLNILRNSEVSVTQGTLPKTLELGSATGGGLIVETGSELNLGKNHLTIIGAGTINSQNQTGKIAFNRNTLTVTSSSAFNSNLYTQPTRDTLAALVTNLTGAALYLRDSVFLTNRVKISNGTVYANNFLTLVSTATQTARIERVEGTGNILGAVHFHRFVDPGRLYRYLSFPVKNVKVSDLQKSVPVTGNFTGRSTGEGLTINPSLFHYVEPAGWLPYPTVSHTEEFSLGRGYSVFIRKATEPSLIKVAGDVQVGNFIYELNAGFTSSNLGWSLVGNPYAAPIQWGGAGWESTGINPTVYVRDNEYGNGAGRFLNWNGLTGDPEFGGLIAQGQAFWVKAFSPVITPSLSVLETAKVDGQAAMFRTRSEEVSTLTISLNQLGLTDRTFLVFNNQSDQRFDPRYDGLKRKNGYYNLATLTADSVLVAIKNLPDSCHLQVALSLEDVKPASYTLSFEGSFFDTDAKELFLRDRYRDSLIRIHPQTVYAFVVSADPLSFGKRRLQLQVETRLLEPLISVEGNQLVSNLETGNQWLLNGEEISGATESNYIPEASGEYQLRISQSGCARTSAPIAYVVTGLEKNQAVSIYPNPAVNAITITGLNTVTNYSILNPVGQKIQQGTLLNTSRDTKITLSTAPGIYLIILENESLLYRAKLIVQ